LKRHFLRANIHISGVSNTTTPLAATTAALSASTDVVVGQNSFVDVERLCDSPTVDSAPLPMKMELSSP